MPNGEVVKLSTYIIAFAASAKVAQQAMSSFEDPMTIAEYKFEINITADFNIKDENDVSVNFWRVSLKNKMTVDYKTHWGITISCIIKPAYTIEGTA
jgi:hypothetical protein